MKFTELLAEALRYNVLYALAAAPEYKASANVLHTILDVGGHPASLDQLIAALDWLGTTGLVDVERLGDAGRALVVANLTTRGLDVAAGRAFATGVRRPLPGEQWQG